MAEAEVVDDGEDAEASASASASSRPRVRALVLASSASFLVTLDLLIVTTALDTVREDLGAPISTLQWVLTAYSVTFACLLLTGAALGDRFGRRRMFAVGVALFVAGSAMAAVSGSIGALIAARVVQGAGGALVLPVGLAIVSSVFPPERRGRAIGILEGIEGMAVIAGPLLGGLIAAHLSWQWIFWINVPIGLVVIPLVLTSLEESYGRDETLDGRGLVLATAAAFGLVWGLVRGNEVGWTSPQIVGALVAGVLAGVLFVWWEARAEEPMLPMWFFGSRRFSAGLAASFLLLASLYSCVFFIAQFLQIGLGHGPLVAGLMLLPWTATLLLVAPAAGALADRVGERPILIVGLTLQAAGVAWLAFVAEAGASYWAVLGPFLVAGVGCSMAVPVTQVAVVGAVDPDEVGKAAGANNMFQELGGALGIAVTVAVFANAGSDASAADFISGFRPAIAVAAALAAIGAFVALSLPRRRTAEAGSPFDAT